MMEDVGQPPRQIDNAPAPGHSVTLRSDSHHTPWPDLARSPTILRAAVTKVVGGRAKPGHDTLLQPVAKLGHDTLLEPVANSSESDVPRLSEPLHPKRPVPSHLNDC